MADRDDLEKEKIKVQQLDNLEPKPIIKDFYFPENSTTFLKNFITPKIYDKLKNVKTSLGGHISHLINSGLNADNKETVGIYATDAEAYTKFTSIFQPAIDFLHNYDKSTSLYNMNDHLGLLKISNPHVEEKLFSIRLKYSRNIKGLPYLPYAKLNTRKEIKEKLLKVISSFEKGKFLDLNTSDKDLINTKLQMYFDKEENFFNSFPNYSKEHAGIYISEDEHLAFLINFNDHLQIVSFNESHNFAEAYHRLTQAHNEISKEVEFDKHEVYGYLTSCPSNIGKGMKISAWLNIPTAVENGQFKSCLSRWCVRVKKNSNPNLKHKGDYEIISKHKLGTSEISFINSFIIKVCSFVNFENNLKENPQYNDRAYDWNKFTKESLRGLYSHYHDNYKLLVTTNLHSFNSMFVLDTKKNNYNIVVPDKECYLIFKDFFFDYVTSLYPTINMINSTSNKEKLEKMYKENPTVEELQAFDDKVNHELLKYTAVIFRRNLKTIDFNSCLSKETLSANYESFLLLANKLKENFNGKVIDDIHMESLLVSDFKFAMRELKHFQGKNSICAYITEDDGTLVLFNGISHLKVVTLAKGKISDAFHRTKQILDFCESNVCFDYDELFGYLNTKPLNSGSSYEMRLTFENVEDIEKIKKACEVTELDQILILNKIVEVYNKNKINESISSCLHKFTLFLTELSK